MKAAGGLYPSLGRYFPKLADLAEAGCMSRQRARDCLDGKTPFTEAEKKAIAANIALRFITSPYERPIGFAKAELTQAITAWNGNFEEVYRKKEG